jgi:hypothetical protein
MAEDAQGVDKRPGIVMSGLGSGHLGDRRCGEDHADAVNLRRLLRLGREWHRKEA